MKSVIHITIILPIFLQAMTTTLPVENPIQYQEQKKIFDTQSKEKKTPDSIYTELNLLSVKEDTNTSEACIRIGKITFENSELLVADELYNISKPYLHRCDTMQEINTLIKKINNLYIEKAYVTSRAYIKAQDLSKNRLIISTMEGKIETVEGKDISTSLVFPYAEQSFLNLRDLEVGLEQLNVNPDTNVEPKEFPIKHYYETNFIIQDENGNNKFDLNLELLPVSIKGNNSGTRKQIILDTTGGK